MTSLEIAELTGKNHFDLLRAIRKMEPAWEKVTGLKFQLSGYKDSTGRSLPCYQFTKTECLYIATKFNDEARAKLVLRWEELEMRGLPRPSEGGEWLAQSGTEGTPLLRRGRERQILALADEIIGEGLRLLNEPAEDTLTAMQVAKTFNMTVWDFNHVLSDMGIQYRRYGRWNLSDDLQGRGYTAERTHVSYSLKGEKKVKVYMTWTMAGLRYLNSKLGYPNF